MLTKGSRVQYKDLSQHPLMLPSCRGTPFMGHCGEVIAAEVLHDCLLHGRECVYTHVKFKNGFVIAIHPEHLIPLDDQE